MFAIECETVEMAGKALAAMRQMVLNTELDESIVKVSGVIKAKSKGDKNERSAVRSDSEG